MVIEITSYTMNFKLGFLVSFFLGTAGRQPRAGLCIYSCPASQTARANITQIPCSFAALPARTQDNTTWKSDSANSPIPSRSSARFSQLIFHPQDGKSGFANLTHSIHIWNYDCMALGYLINKLKIRQLHFLARQIFYSSIYNNFV